MAELPTTPTDNEHAEPADISGVSLSWTSLNGALETPASYSRSLRLDNACFILSAQFDNKLGPVIRHQYPKCIPGFKNHLCGTSDSDESINLASLMIPNNVELTPGKKDYTMFSLYYNNNTDKYELFKPTSDTLNDNNYNTIREVDEFEDAQEHHESNHIDVLYILNIVNTIIDKTNSRGAVIKSIALVTPNKIGSIFRPLLSKVLDQYMKTPSTESIEVLKECFNMINSLDLSIINRIYSNKYLQKILQSINEESNFNSTSNNLLDVWFDEKIKKLFKKIFKIPYNIENDNFGNKVTLINNYIQYSFTNFTSSLLDTDILETKLRVSLFENELLGSSTRFNTQILNFLSKFINYTSSLPTENITWRLVINSTLYSKDELCHFVLILSNILNSIFEFGKDMNRYYQRKPILIFPYIDISMIDSLRTYSSNLQGSKFFIIGVANPIFQFQQNLWDCYYDIDTETFYNANEIVIKNKEKTEYPLFNKNLHRNGSLSIRKIFSKPGEIIIKTPKNVHSRVGLLQKCIQNIIAEEANYDQGVTTKIFKKVNLLQLIQLLTAGKVKDDVSVLDQYLCIYKDAIIFPEFFDYTSLQMLKTLSNIHNCIEMLYQMEILSESTSTMTLKKLKHHQHILFSLIASNKNNMDSLINILLNYPTFKIFDNFDLQSYDFSNQNLEKLFDPSIKSSIFRDLSDNTTFQQQLYKKEWINAFMKVDGFLLLTIPLLFEPSCTTNHDLFGNIPRFFLKPASHGLGRSKLTRTISLKRLFPLNPVSSNNGNSNFFAPSDHSITELPDNIRRSSLPMNLPHSSKSSTSLSTQSIKSVPETSQEQDKVNSFKPVIERCKKYSIKLVHYLLKRPLGQILYSKFATEQIKFAFETSKKLYYDNTPNKPNDTLTKVDASKNKDKDKTRSELLKEISIIGERFKVTAASNDTMNIL
ncbi:hypothetical protein TPHA_0J02690 [Tetrapisispora phaffii CBS 4417]|uniref:Arf3-interacting protein 1 N-terminal domain-containing protein n=1 Tax=Tetrapisispora phaffii (strain ATCC 24235 / CBS 4417 / NBRC 1672 / NRRL Y-8282 / UCD 70-5) TaxID=1071381 RepID=G8BYZ7_TETPH|nr:hypothetical protein TPHA_0J02690 [Tetrapisispora phaffii CBS 4417]CCE65089.1 hypothetical protein TPHA_0J02690 [Tetrapisispora phaffii CBS 4417]